MQRMRGELRHTSLSIKVWYKWKKNRVYYLVSELTQGNVDIWVIWWDSLVLVRKYSALKYYVLKHFKNSMFP